MWANYRPRISPAKVTILKEQFAIGATCKATTGNYKGSTCIVMHHTQGEEARHRKTYIGNRKIRPGPI